MKRDDTDRKDLIAHFIRIVGHCHELDSLPHDSRTSVAIPFSTRTPMPAATS